MSFALTGWMLYAMWVVLGLIGLNFLVSLFRSLSNGNFSHSIILNYLRDVLYYVFPLFLLANIASLDPTDWLVLIAYYIGVIGIVIHYIIEIKNKF